ncbi:MAG: hypothetical protein MZW92_43305 [Comamonadaceae bacterium]|nr:hypothetical protein [Comamonadaceae bacterium]
MERNLRELLKSRAPHLYESLSRSGELEHFIYYKGAAISNEVTHQRYREMGLPAASRACPSPEGRAQRSHRRGANRPAGRAAVQADGTCATAA